MSARGDQLRELARQVDELLEDGSGATIALAADHVDAPAPRAQSLASFASAFEGVQQTLAQLGGRHLEAARLWGQAAGVLRAPASPSTQRQLAFHVPLPSGEVVVGCVIDAFEGRLQLTVLRSDSTLPVPALPQAPLDRREQLVLEGALYRHLQTAAARELAALDGATATDLKLQA